MNPTGDGDNPTSMLLLASQATALSPTSVSLYFLCCWLDQQITISPQCVVQAVGLATVPGVGAGQCSSSFPARWSRELECLKGVSHICVAPVRVCVCALVRAYCFQREGERANSCRG